MSTTIVFLKKSIKTIIKTILTILKMLFIINFEIIFYIIKKI